MANKELRNVDNWREATGMGSWNVFGGSTEMQSALREQCSSGVQLEINSQFKKMLEINSDFRKKQLIMSSGAQSKINLYTSLNCRLKAPSGTSQPTGLRDKKKGSQRDLFKASGPIHLTLVNWKCPDYQRSVVACLVHGACAIERDRQFDRQSHEARAPAWWESFHFELVRELVDDADQSVFGAIYQYKPPATFQSQTISGAPSFVIVFRGTILKKKSRYRDIELNGHFLKNDLHETSRFRIAMQAVRDLVPTFGHQSLWIAGHSLGAAIAILAGKNMAKEGLNLKAFLFNPPSFSVPIERIKNESVKQGILIAKSYITAWLTLVVKGPRHNSDSFTMLSSWLPHLFVNKADDICSAYIRYFEHRQKMEEIGAGKVGKLATQNSIKDLVFSVFGMESESLHRFPSAILTVNSSPVPDFKHAHGIHQWWRTDLNLHATEYRYD